jgi:hypothetical protein
VPCMKPGAGADRNPRPLHARQMVLQERLAGANDSAAGMLNQHCRS